MNDHTEATSPTRRMAPLAIILGIPLILAAVFFYTSPVVLMTGGAQGIFKCGSPSSPNTDAKNVCSDPEKVARNKAVYSGLSGAALVGLGSVWLLRGQRDEDDWDDDGRDRDRDRDRGMDRDRDERRRRRSDDDIDLRADTRDRDADPERPGGLRGVSRSDEHDDDRARDIEDSRAARRRSEGRRSVLRDDDFADPEPRRRADDDWSSDGWR